jgi:hypothetical protein
MRLRSFCLAAALLAAACGSSSPAADDRPIAALPPDPGFEGPGLVSPEVFARTLQGKRLDDWYGMYLADHKVGWMHMTLRPTEQGEPGGWTWRMEGTVVDAGVGDGPTESHFAEQAFYDPAPPYRMIAYHTGQRSRDETAEIRYTVTGGGIRVEETVGGERRPQRTLPATRETLASAMVQLSLDPALITPGRTATFWGFDSDDERDERTVVKVARIEERRLAGVLIKVATVIQETEGEAPMEVVVASGGRVLAANVGQVVMRLEDEEVARSNVVGFDLVRDAVPYQGGELGEPTQVTALRLRIEGLPDGYPMPDGPNQRVSSSAGGIVLQLASVPGEPVGAAERTAALAVTPTIDWRDPAIVSRSARLLAGAGSDRERVDRLLRWVYRTLEKDLSTNISRASQVLARKVGDCTEHSLLLVALARAAGIPARPVAGVTYMGDELGRFGWHEWVEVELDGKWVQVDPSWSESIANATHIKLEDDDSGRSVALYGAIRLEQLPAAR